MGNLLGRLTGRSPAYSAVLLFVVARYTALLVRGPRRTAPTAQVALLQRIAGVLASPGRIPQLLSDALGKGVKLRVSTHGLRSVEHNGGLDNWLLKTRDEKLSARALKVKRELKKAQDAA